MNNISKILEKLKKSILSKADVVKFGAFAKKPVTSAPAAGPDLRSRNDKIKDALAAQGKVDDRVISDKGGMMYRAGQDDKEDAPTPQDSEAIFRERVANARAQLDAESVVDKRKELRLKSLSTFHGRSGETAAPFYKKMLDAEDKHELNEENVPGMNRKVSYLGPSANGHMFSVKGVSKGETHHLFEVSGAGKKPDFTRYPALPHVWSVANYEGKPHDINEMQRQVNQDDADTSKYAHLALKAVKYSKTFKDLFPEAGKYTEHGEFHPKDFKAEYLRNGWGHRKLTDTLGYAQDHIRVKGRHKSDRSFEVIHPRKFDEASSQVGTPMDQISYVVLPHGSDSHKEESKKILEAILKDPKNAQMFPQGYQVVNDSKEATDKIRQLAFRVAKSTQFMETLRKSAMKYNEIKGGEAAGMTPKDFTPAEQKAIVEGEKIENDEHGSHGTEIAMDHVAELGKKYYKELKQMENSIKGKLEKAKAATYNELSHNVIPPSYGTIPNIGHQEAMELSTKHSKLAQKYGSEGQKDSAAFHHAQASQYWNHGQKAKAAAPMTKADPVGGPALNPAGAAAVNASVSNPTADFVAGVKNLFKAAPAPVKPVAPVKAAIPSTVAAPKLPNPSAIPLTKKIAVTSKMIGHKVATTDGFAKQGLQKADVGDAFAKALAAHNQHGGSTYCFQKGDLAGKPLFAVSPHKDREQLIDGPLTKEHLAAFHAKNKDLFGQEGHVLGTWHDPSSNKSFLDVTMVTPDHKQAMEIGQKHSQKAIFDLGNMKTIHLDHAEKSIPVPPMVKSEEIGTEDEGDPIEGTPVKVSSKIMKCLKAKANANFHTETGDQTSAKSAQTMINGVPETAVPMVPLNKADEGEVAEQPTEVSGAF